MQGGTNWVKTRQKDKEIDIDSVEGMTVQYICFEYHV